MVNGQYSRFDADFLRHHKYLFPCRLPLKKPQTVIIEDVWGRETQPQTECAGGEGFQRS